MLGVLINTLAVAAGSLIGLCFRRGIPKKVTDSVMTGLGLCTLYIGIDGLMDGKNVLILIFSVVFGAIIGTLADLDGAIFRFSGRVEHWFSHTERGESSFAQGFMTAGLLFCVGAMTIVGCLNAGLTGNNEILFTKSTLDFFSSMMLAVSLGVGVLCSAAFVLAIEGAIVLLAGFLQPILLPEVIPELVCTGSLLILAIGLNILGITKIKVANYLPAIVIAPLLAWSVLHFPVLG